MIIFVVFLFLDIFEFRVGSNTTRLERLDDYVNELIRQSDGNNEKNP